MKDIKTTATTSSPISTPDSTNRVQTTQKSSINRSQGAKPIVKQKIVQQPKNIKLKKWLPVAIQLAKTGYSYYQNNIAQSSVPASNVNERQQAVARNFLQPEQSSQHGNPYDRIPELRKT